MKKEIGEGKGEDSGGTKVTFNKVQTYDWR